MTHPLFNSLDIDYTDILEAPHEVDGRFPATDEAMNLLMHIRDIAAAIETDRISRLDVNWAEVRDQAAMCLTNVRGEG